MDDATKHASTVDLCDAVRELKTKRFTSRQTSSKTSCSPPYRAHERRPYPKLHSVCDGQGRPVAMPLSVKEISDQAIAAYFIDELPPGEPIGADRGYDRDGYRAAFDDKDITPLMMGFTEHLFPDSL